MKEKLLELHKNSYCPYSNFEVSAAVVMKDGKTFFGVNVENSNGTSICAERNAIASAVCAGYKKGDFLELNVMVSSGKIGTPCFACRQVIIEFLDLEDTIRCYATTGEYTEYAVKDLCPYPFGSEDLV